MKNNKHCFGLQLSLFAAVGFFYFLQPAVAGTNDYWVCGSGLWDSLCWSATAGGTPTVSQPLNGDYVYLTQSDSVNRTVTYQNTTFPNAVLQALTIDATGTGAMTLSQDTYSDPLNSSGEMIGIVGTGNHAQSIGTNSVGSLYVAYGSIGYGGATGTYLLSGSGSLIASYEYIGYRGTGTFTQTGGTNQVSAILYVGVPALGNGNYVLSGGSLTAGTEYVQDGGTFTQNNGTHTVTNNLIIRGGNYNLSGSGNLVVANESLGGYSNPTFIQTGGSHTVNGNLTFGQGVGMNGNYILSGGTLNVVGNIVQSVYGGVGTLNIDGGTLSVGGGNGAINVYNLYVGSTVGSTGGHTLSGTGSLSATNEYIGYSGTGNFNQIGGINTADTLTIAANSTSSGVYSLNGGTLSTATIATGTGISTLNINGGTLSVGGGNGSVNVVNLTLGSIANTSGSHTLSGTGSITAVNETIGSFGTGNFTQNGGTHTVTNTLTLAANAGSSGAYNLNGGTLNAANIQVNSGGKFNFSGGRLAAGTFVGNVVNNGGTLAPGDTNIGATNIVGNYSQSGSGAFAVKLGGTNPGQFDTLYVSGTATLDGTLNISPFDLGSGLYTPQAGDTFNFLTAAGLSGQFSSLSYAPLGNGLVWDVSYLFNGTGYVVALTAAPVPIPAAFWLFGSGLIGLFGFMCKRK